MSWTSLAFITICAINFAVFAYIISCLESLVRIVTRLELQGKAAPQ